MFFFLFCPRCSRTDLLDKDLFSHIRAFHTLVQVVAPEVAAKVTTGIKVGLDHQRYKAKLPIFIPYMYIFFSIDVCTFFCSKEHLKGCHLVFRHLRHNDALVSLQGLPFILSTRVFQNGAKVSLYAQSFGGPQVAKAFR